MCVCVCVCVCVFVCVCLCVDASTNSNVGSHSKSLSGYSGRKWVWPSTGKSGCGLPLLAKVHDRGEVGEEEIGHHL